MVKQWSPLRASARWTVCRSICKSKLISAAAASPEPFKTVTSSPPAASCPPCSASIRDGDELPSRRVLSALLGVNPNTVQKAFRLLEDEGLIASHSGAKSYVTVDEGKLAALRQTLLREELRAVTRSLRQMGIAREDALRLISEFWEESSCENT